MVLSGTSITWSSSERDAGPRFDPGEDIKQRHDAMQLPFKVYMDLIAEGCEISRIRADYLARNINAYLNLPPSARFGPDHVQIANRLHAGYLELAGRTPRQAYRTDYIGHEVDRFFRASKAALPGTVTIGESLFEKLDAQSRPMAYPGLFLARLTHKPDPTSGTLMSREDILYMKHVLVAEDMKGIGYPYITYHLLTLTQLRMLHHGRFADEQILAPTLRLFSKTLLASIQTVAEREGSQEGP